MDDFPSIVKSKNVENLKRKKDDIVDETIKRVKTFHTINIYTDGGCSKNGSTNAVAGIGVYFENGEYENISKKIEGKQTNNRAELTAILEALKTVDIKNDIVIHTDSEYCINGILGRNKILKNSDLFESIHSMISKRTGGTKFKKVVGHSGVKDGNYYADILATKALIQ